MKTIHLFAFILFPIFLLGQEVPKSYSNIFYEKGKLLLKLSNGKTLEAQKDDSNYILENLQGNPKGTEEGVAFDFNFDLDGTLYYGFIPYGDSKHPQPVFFKYPAEIKNGKAEINISKLKGKYDMIGWESKGQGTVGYRVVNKKGIILYDGRVTFRGKGPFSVDYTILEGPIVNKLEPDGVTISFTTNKEMIGTIKVEAELFKEEQFTTNHEIKITDLQPDTEYEYSLIVDNQQYDYSFRTAPALGTRTSFSFAYVSDSRSGQGGGERNVYGANFYIMKKMMALLTQQKARFLQFSGDLITGYSKNIGETELQYVNWKRAIGPFTHYTPVYTTMGNHEALNIVFNQTDDYRKGYSIDRFPFETESAEAIYAKHFVNYTNGPESEDGSQYDPDTTSIDFPPYEETVYHYTYDNVAIIVLNSDYWYSPSTGFIDHTSGGLHAYIMDNQLEWLRGVISEFEFNTSIDHIFITQHTPFFPNGGHVSDDMWYDGNNEYRPFIAGEPVEKGIIERRDELLQLLVNESTKVRVILTGDEHNYARTEITPDTPIYPPGYTLPQLKLNRTI